MLSNKEKDYIFAELKEKNKHKIIDLLRRNGETVTVIDKKRRTKFKDIVTGIRKGRIISRNYQKILAPRHNL